MSCGAARRRGACGHEVDLTGWRMVLLLLTGLSTWEAGQVFSPVRESNTALSWMPSVFPSDINVLVWCFFWFCPVVFTVFSLFCVFLVWTCGVLEIKPGEAEAPPRRRMDLGGLWCFWGLVTSPSSCLLWSLSAVGSLVTLPGR